ncbi:MAG: IPT/TIG domain-containing protein, partial [Thermoguttaceae bacterium]
MLQLLARLLFSGKPRVPTAPTVAGVNPSSGATIGGASVTITGTGFSSVSAVKFGSTAAASYTVNSTRQITAVVPAGSAGTVDVTVTTPLGTSATSSADDFTFVALYASPKRSW